LQEPQFNNSKRESLKKEHCGTFGKTKLYKISAKKMEHSDLLMFHRKSTEKIVPLLTITGVDSTFLSTIRLKPKCAFHSAEIFIDYLRQHGQQL